jgi:hypothetical protein
MTVYGVREVAARGLSGGCVEMKAGVRSVGVNLPQAL